MCVNLKRFVGAQLKQGKVVVKTIEELESETYDIIHSRKKPA